MEKTKQILKVQGDIFFIKIESIPKFSNPPQKIEPKNGRVVLRRGEATGHEHAISLKKEDKIDVFQVGDIIYILNRTAVKVTHPEHRAIILEPGIWKMGVQREFDPFERTRFIRD